jgi:hypothetical protein
MSWSSGTTTPGENGSAKVSPGIPVDTVTFANQLFADREVVKRTHAAMSDAGKTSGKTFSFQAGGPNLIVGQLPQFKDRSQYEGASLNGMRHGHGTLRYPEGSVYTGPFYMGQKHGVSGKLIFHDGSR